MNNKDSQKKPLPEPGEKKQDDENQQALERGKSAVKAQHDQNDKPPEIKNKEEAEDAEKWRNEG